MNLDFKKLIFLWDKVILVFLIMTYITVMSRLSILRHNAFASSFDLANMDHTVWNTINGRFFSLMAGEEIVSRFSIHADLILVLLSPLYLIWNNVRMLIISESTALGIAAIPIYFLAKHVLKNKIISLLIATSYLLNPGVQWTNIYDFHGVSFAIPFLISAFFFAYTKKWRWYFLFIFLSLVTKEQISLFVSVIGLIVAVMFKERWIGLATFLIGIFWFVLMVFIVMPIFSPDDKHWALDWYRFKDDAGADIRRIPTIDILAEKFVFSPDAKDYYIMLLKPFGFLPLLGLPWIILALPELGINLLSTQAQMRSIFLHYDSGVIPALIIALIFGLKYLQIIIEKSVKRLDKRGSFKYLPKFAIYLSAIWLILVALRVNYNYSPLPTTPSCWCIMYNATEEDKKFEEILQKIPEEASITASSEIRPHITHRKSAFNLPSATQSAQYIAIIDQNRIVGDYELKDFEGRLLKALAESKDHELVEQIDHFYLYKRID